MNIRSRRAEEGGVTLVEVLLAVAILGIAISSIVSAMGSASLASDYHRKNVNGDTVVRSYAEVIKQRASVGAYFASCTPIPSYAVPASVWAPPSGYSVSVASVQFWHSGSGFTTTCGTDEGAQLLALQAQSTDGRDTESLDVIVRQP